MQVYADMDTVTVAEPVTVDGTVNATLATTTDAVTGTLTTITYPHHEVHSGSTFHISYFCPHDGLIANDANLDLRFTTGAKYCHITWADSTGGDAESYLYEDGNVTGGTDLAEVNVNRASTKTATAAGAHTPTVTTTGDLLQAIFIPGGTGPRSVGTQVLRGTEWILELNTTYLFRCTNRAGTAQQMGVMLQWYEESA
jgi:hypothetical protein